MPCRCTIGRAFRRDRSTISIKPGRNLARILASYETGEMLAYYVEPVAVGDNLREMPLFLAEGWQVPVPLESTYQITWNTSPEDFRRAVETGLMPEAD